MAFTTEFVMGAGGAVEVEEIPVSMSGGGIGNVYPLTAVNADSGAWVWVDGARTGNGLLTLRVGSLEYRAANDSARMGGGGYFSGTVQIDALSRISTTSSFTGTVYVIRV